MCSKVPQCPQSLIYELFIQKILSLMYINVLCEKHAETQQLSTSKFILENLDKKNFRKNFNLMINEPICAEKIFFFNFTKILI